MSKHLSKLLVSASAAAIGWTGLVGTAAAQIDQIVVTAERREGNLQQVPLSVSAFDRGTLETRQINAPADLERFTPSLKMRNNITSPTNLSPALRGSTQQDASLAVAESPFGIYVDDIYMARLNGNNIELADIERVEVLRGPQGTLYGRNTLAGAIKFITRTPDADNQWLDAEFGYGNFDSYKGSISVGGPVSDALAASFSFQTNGFDGYFTNVATGKDVGAEENYAGRVKLHYIGSDVFDVVASVSYTKSQSDSLPLIPATTPTVPGTSQFEFDDLVPTFGFYELSTPAVPRGPSFLTPTPQAETEQLIANVTITWDLGFATVKSITGYVDTQDFFVTDFSGTGVTIGGMQLDTYQISEELQILGTAFDDKLSYIGGFFYFDDQADQAFAWNFTIPPLGLFNSPVSTSLIETDTRSIAVFGQVDYNITPDLKVTGGIRYTRDKKNFDFTFDTLFLPFPVPTEIINLDDTFSAWTPKFGIDYQVPVSGDFVDSMLLYFSASRGFKSGGYNGINIFDATIARSEYGPETNWTYEGGIKTELAGNRVRINANYFYNQISELTLNATVDLGGGMFAFPVQNAGDATIQGLEVEAVFQPVDGLNIFGNLAVLDGEFKNLDPTSPPAQAPINFGVEAVPPSVPDFEFALGFDYGIDVPLGNTDSRFTFGVNYYYTDKYVSAADQEGVVSAYGRLNGFAAVEINETWKLNLTMENIQDKETIITGSRGLGGFLTQPPRTFMLSLKYSM